METDNEFRLGRWLWLLLLMGGVTIALLLVWSQQTSYDLSSGESDTYEEYYRWGKLKFSPEGIAYECSVPGIFACVLHTIVGLLIVVATLRWCLSKEGCVQVVLSRKDRFKAFLRENLTDLSVVFWLGMLAQIIPILIGGSANVYRNYYGFPFGYYGESVDFESANSLLYRDGSYESWFNYKYFVFNVIIISSFSLLYVYGAKKVFLSIGLESKKVTLTSAALLFIMGSLFLCHRSWALLICYKADDISMNSYYLGFPIESGPFAVRRIFENLLCGMFVSTLSAFAVGCWCKWRGEGKELRSSK